MRSSVLLLALAFGLAAPGLALADWMRDYDRGLKAIRDGDWAEAEAKFRSAMRERKEPKARERFQGTRFEAYVPQHFAGYAAWQRGDCASAIEYWQTPGLEAALREDKLAGAADRVADRQRGMADCGQRLAAAKPPAPSTPAVAGTVQTDPPVTATPASGKPAALSPAASAPAAERAPAAPTVAVAPPPTKPSSTPPPVTRPEPVVASKPPPARAAAINPALASAIDAYLGGRYADLERIELPPTSDAAARAQVLLLRAAARHIAVELAGGNAAALDPARADVRAARAAQASLNPDAAMFPPRFRSFWQQTR